MLTKPVQNAKQDGERLVLIINEPLDQAREATDFGPKKGIKIYSRFCLYCFKQGLLNLHTGVTGLLYKMLLNCYILVLLNCCIQVLLNCHVQVLINCYIQVLLNCYVQVLLSCYIQVLLNCCIQFYFIHRYQLYIMLQELR